MELIYSNPYHSAPENRIRRLCYRVKEDRGWLDIPGSMLFQMASALGPKTVLVPVPGHDGKAGYTLDICFALRRHAGRKDVRIVDALQGNAHPPLCETKHAGGNADAIPVTFMLKESEIDAGQVRTLAKDFDIVLVDNVIDSGRTALLAEKALGVPCKLITIGTTGRSGLAMPKLYYEVVRLSDQDTDRESFTAVKTLIDRDGDYQEAVRYLSDWDFGAENLGAATVDDEGLRACVTDPRSNMDKVIDRRDGYYLCHCATGYYEAYYLVSEVPRKDLLPDGANARTGKGTPVRFEYIPDCGSNAGGFYVQIYVRHPEYEFNSDSHDSLCVHPGDCDCNDLEAVETHIKKTITEIQDY